VTAPLDIVAARAEWEKVSAGHYWSQIVPWSVANVPALLDHIEVLHRGIRRAATDEQITHPEAYLRTLLDEVTG
jgi:hypothetical protein